jgi:hypothetical protein
MIVKKKDKILKVDDFTELSVNELKYDKFLPKHPKNL